MTAMSNRGHVLVVDDEETVVTLVCSLLAEAGYTTVTANSGEEALEIFKINNNIDMAITDVQMGGMDGFELMKQLKLIDKNLNIIVMTGFVSYETVLKALQSGAYDYMAKPLDNHAGLLAAVDRACTSSQLLRENTQLIKELEASHARLSKANEGLLSANHKLQKLASTDTLTLLYNRRYFEQVLKREVDRRNRYKLALSVVMIDIDHFKEINDTYGHEAGDKALRRVASVITESARTTDIIARFGGEEFVAVLPETEPESAAVFAERTRATLEAEEFSIDGHEIKLTMSLGVSGITASGDFADPETMIKIADKALYAAKNGGRNRFVRAPDINNCQPCNKPGNNSKAA